jgi:hypothetical protein
MTKRNDGNVNELTVFHKLIVEMDKLDEILENNLDKEYTVLNSKFNKLGNGIYFMTDPSKCDFMDKKKGGTMIMSKILAGYWTKKCDQTANLPPFRVSNIRYDSTIDQFENNICIFDKNQIMPLYLISYE